MAGVRPRGLLVGGGALAAGFALVAASLASQPQTAVSQSTTAPATTISAAPSESALRAEGASRNAGGARPSLSGDLAVAAAKAAKDKAAKDKAAKDRAAKDKAAKDKAAKDKAAKDKAAKDKALAERAAKRSAEAKAAAEKLAAAAVTGRRYVTAPLNVRTAPDADSARVATLQTGAKVAITSVVDDGFRRISFEGRARWVKSDYLSKDKPEPASDDDNSSGNDDSGNDDSGDGSGATSDSDDQDTSGSSSGGFASGPCASGSSVEGGITQATIRVHRAVCNRFPQVRTFGGYRSDYNSAHGSGRALDAMISDSGVGWQIARWVRSNARALGVTEVIYAQKIWTTQRAGDGWRGMSDRGSASANHYDHVHITVG